MINTTLKRAVDSVPALQELAQLQMPAKTAYLIGRAIRKVNEEASGFNDAWNRLLSSLGTPNPDDPTKFNIPEANRAEFKKQSEELQRTIVYFDMEPVGLSDIVAIGNVKPAWMCDLDWLIDEEK